jgi:hypothetical protein
VSPRLLFVVVPFVVLACGDGRPPPKPVEAPIPSSPRQANPTLPSDESSWGKFHSRRFQLTLPLPDGHAWRIDDHSSLNLFAIHEATSSRIELTATQEDELMNRAKCEERARTSGWVPNGPLTTVEDETASTPESYDSRLWVALDPGQSGGALVGHVFLFGSLLRRCLVVHFMTRVPSMKEADVMSSRLAVAYRAIRNIKTDGPRTTDDAVLPRAKPDITR